MGMYVTHLVRRKGIHFTYTHAKNAMNMGVWLISIYDTKYEVKRY